MPNDNYESIIQWHPEMILVSKNPVTWKGFINIPCNAGRNMRVRLKLIVHDYPLLHGAEINFGKEIAYIRNKEFSEKVKELLHNVSKVSTFLKQLQSLISNYVINRSVNENNGYEEINNETRKILKELRDVLEVPSGIKVSSDSSLSIIKLSLNNVSMRLKRIRNNTCPWTVIYSDLPEVPGFGSFDKNVLNLTIAKNKFKLQIEILEKAWSNLKQIDENCWIIDPLQPKPCHLYRRIYLSPSSSMFIKIDPLNSMDLPEIKFMGSDLEVQSNTELASKNLHNWRSKHDIINNLKMLLNIDMFPKKEVKEEPTKDYNAVVADEECCICFSSKLDNNLPDKICNNEKCRRHFHTSCLLQWLQAVAGNHIVFGHIHGSCPNCQESISCYIG